MSAPLHSSQVSPLAHLPTSSPASSSSTTISSQNLPSTIICKPETGKIVSSDVTRGETVKEFFYLLQQYGCDFDAMTSASCFTSPDQIKLLYASVVREVSPLFHRAGLLLGPGCELDMLLSFWAIMQSWGGQTDRNFSVSVWPLRRRSVAPRRYRPMCVRSTSAPSPKLRRMSAERALGGAVKGRGVGVGVGGERKPIFLLPGSSRRTLMMEPEAMNPDNAVRSSSVGLKECNGAERYVSDGRREFETISKGRAASQRGGRTMQGDVEAFLAILTRALEYAQSQLRDEKLGSGDGMNDSNLKRKRDGDVVIDGTGEVVSISDPAIQNALSALVSHPSCKIQPSHTSVSIPRSKEEEANNCPTLPRTPSPEPRHFIGVSSPSPLFASSGREVMMGWEDSSSSVAASLSSNRRTHPEEENGMLASHFASPSSQLPSVRPNVLKGLHSNTSGDACNFEKTGTPGGLNGHSVGPLTTPERELVIELLPSYQLRDFIISHGYNPAVRLKTKARQSIAMVVNHLRKKFSKAFIPETPMSKQLRLSPIVRSQRHSSQIANGWGDEERDVTIGDVFSMLGAGGEVVKLRYSCQHAATAPPVTPPGAAGPDQIEWPQPQAMEATTTTSTVGSFLSFSSSEPTSSFHSYSQASTSAISQHPVPTCRSGSISDRSVSGEESAGRSQLENSSSLLSGQDTMQGFLSGAGGGVLGWREATDSLQGLLGAGIGMGAGDTQDSLQGLLGVLRGRSNSGGSDEGWDASNPFAGYA